MTVPAPTTTYDDDDDFDSPLTLKDWVEVIADDLESAVEGLNAKEVEQLCRAIRKKLDDILAEADDDGDDDALEVDQEEKELDDER